MEAVCPQLTEADVRAAHRGVISAARSYHVQLTYEEIEDLTQTALLRFLERACASRVDNRHSYLAQIGRSCVVDLVRHQRAARRDARRTKPLGDFDAPGGVSPERACGSREELVMFLERCRAILSPRYFRVFQLSHVHGFTGAETAAACGLSQGNVYSILSRARRKLKTAGIALRGRSPCR